MTPAGRKALAGLAFAGAAAALVAAWDWNWFRGPLERHLAEQSGRAVQIDGLEVDFPDFPNPTVRLRDVAIDNAPWVTATRGQPFARAGEVAFTFGLRGLLLGRPVVSVLGLVDADVALERQADGLRNWRLGEPDDRGPPKFKILRLHPVRSRLRFVHEGLRLDLVTQAAPLDRAEGERTTRIGFKGSWRGTPFDGSADTGPTLTFVDTGEAFALRGSATSGPTRLTVDGHVADLFHLRMVDADLVLSGPTFADLHRLLPAAWPDTAAYTVTTRLAKGEGQWAFTALRASVGRSDVSGELRYNETADRPYLETTLTSQVTHFSDVWRGTAPSGAAPGDPPALRRFDGEANLTVRSLHLPHVPPLTQVRVTARLDDGLLDLSPVQAQAAGGALQGLASWDARQQPAAARTEGTWRGLRLEQLLPALPGDGEVTGPVAGQWQLTGRGDTLDALLASAAGRAEATLRGGRLSAGLDARLALDGGKLLRATVADAADVPILCGRVGLALKDGRGEVFPLLFDTARTRVDGRGRLVLTERRAELVLTPRRKQAALLALDRSLRVTATPDGADVKLVPPEAITPEAPCDAPAAVKAR